jgi:hypothetical protein
MKTLSSLAFCIATLSPIHVSRAQRVPPVPLIDDRHASILAFFPPLSNADLENGNTNEALSDFQFYAESARQPLRQAGIDFREVYASTFRVHIDNGTTFFHTRDKIGYYFVAPGKRPYIVYGVMTDDDLLQTAKRYFRSTTLPHR